MSENYPLYPTLTEQGETEAQQIMDAFKERFKDAASGIINDIMGDIYCDVVPHIGSDSWTNYCNHIMSGFRGYKTECGNHAIQFKELRQAIYKNNKEEIVRDLNQDLVEQVEKLEKQIESLYAQMG